MVSLGDIVLRHDLDPRMGKLNGEKIARYAGMIGDLPPIEINQHRELIDGWHRYFAARQTGCTDLPYFVTETVGDIDLVEKMWAANASYRVVYDSQQRRAFAMILYQMGQKPKEIVRRCGVSSSQIYEWTKEARAADKADRDRRVVALKAQGMTERAIAGEVKIGESTVRRILARNAKIRKTTQARKILAKPKVKPAPVAMEARKDKTPVNVREQDIDENIAPPATGQRQPEREPTRSEVHRPRRERRHTRVAKWKIRMGQYIVWLGWDPQKRPG